MPARDPDRIDFLEEDPEISSQKYVLLSLVQPQSMIQKRELFYMTEFFRKVCARLELPEQTAVQLQEDFESFKDLNGKILDEKFSEANDDQTCVTGLKIRGSYGSEREAKIRAKALQKRDPDFNVFLASVGKWLPISPSIDYHIENEEYLEEQLQDLMHNYKENQKMKDDLFEKTKKEKMAGLHPYKSRPSSTLPSTSSGPSGKIPKVSLATSNLMQSIENFDHQSNKNSFEDAMIEEFEADHSQTPASAPAEISSEDLPHPSSSDLSTNATAPMSDPTSFDALLGSDHQKNKASFEAHVQGSGSASS